VLWCIAQNTPAQLRQVVRAEQPRDDRTPRLEGQDACATSSPSRNMVSTPALTLEGQTGAFDFEHVFMRPL
jgi:hypothetical protein